MEIVRATADKAEDIGYVHAMSWKEAYRGIVPQEFLDNFTPEKRADAFRKTFPSSQDEFYIAYLNNKPMGMLIILYSEQFKGTSFVLLLKAAKRK